MSIAKRGSLCESHMLWCRVSLVQMTCHKSTGRATLAMRWTACNGNADVACNGCPKILNVAGVLMMSTLVSCVQRFSIHDLLLVVSSQHLWNVVVTSALGEPDLRSAASRALLARSPPQLTRGKDEKRLWLACQSTGDSTGGRAHGSTVIPCFVLLNSLMSALFLSMRRRSHHIGMKIDWQ